MTDLLEYLSSPFVLRALIGVFLIAINAALSGVFASFRSLTFLVSGASHAALAGAALIIVLEAYGLVHLGNPVLGGAVFAVALALLAGGASFRSSDRAADPAIGVGFAFSMALAVLLISLIPESATRVWGVLIGDLLLLSNQDLLILGSLTGLVVLLFGVLRREFLFITFDMDGARAFGIQAGVYNYILFALIGLSAAILMKGVGAIVVFAMLVSPGAAALLIGSTVNAVVAWAFGIAFASGLIGIVLSYYIDFSVSALAAIISAASYFIAKGVIWVQSRGKKAEG